MNFTRPIPHSRAWRITRRVVLMLLIVGVLWGGQRALIPFDVQSSPYLLASGSVQTTAGTPVLLIPSGLRGSAGGLLQVPILFDSGGAAVSSLSFSLDYDQDCLSFTPEDEDADGLPDAVVLDAPAAFFPSVSWNPDDPDGEFDIVLADYIPPLLSLPESNALFTFQFRIICPVPPEQSKLTYVHFAPAPTASFSDLNGGDLAGETRDSTIQLTSAPPIATMPSSTLTSTPHTATPTPPLLLTPTPPPGLLLETSVWPDPLTHSDRTLALVVDYVILTDVRNSTLAVELPPYTRAATAISTAGWQCSNESACRLALPSISTSGRVFLMVEVEPLPAAITQLALGVTLAVNEGLSSRTQSVVVPVLAAEVTPPGTMTLPGELTLGIDTPEADLRAGYTSPILYVVTYINHTTTKVSEATLHIVLPEGASLLPVKSAPAEWVCTPDMPAQSACVLLLETIEPGASRQVSFQVEWEPASETTPLILVVYILQNGQVLSSSSSVLPFQSRPTSDAVGITLFLPIAVS